jgi:D-glycero-D-manno-heptose 1,7-bisphosphate phosphatase
MQNKALFLDRDGVINVDHGYVHKAKDFEFVPGIFDLVRAANANDYKVIVVTNQAGIGRGYYTESQFHALTEWMCQQFKLNGCRIDAVYFCPYHPEHGIGEYRRESDCRKPAPGMLLQAQKDHNINLQASVFVGDKPSDMAAGRNAGIQNLMYFSDEKVLNGERKKISTLHEVLHDFFLICENN